MHRSRLSRIIIILGIFAGLGISAVHPGLADLPDTILYTTDFSDTSGWETNSAERFYPDNATGRYHYLLEGGTGGYSAAQLPEEINGPFVLEFDVTPVKTDEGATFRFGIGSEDKDSQKGPLIMAELANKKGGRLFYLKTVSRENALNLVGSSPSAGSVGSTVRYEEETRYHVRLTYYEKDTRASLVVQDPESGKTLFTTIAPVSGSMGELTHLFLTSVGDGVPGPQAEGYIDNITLTVPGVQPEADITTPARETAPITPTPTLADGMITEKETPVLDPLPSRTRTDFPSPPTPTPTRKSGSFPFLLIVSLAGAAFIATRKP